MEDAGGLPGWAFPWVGAPWPPFAPASAQPCVPVALKQPQEISPLWLPTVANPGLGTCRTVPLGVSIFAPQQLGTQPWAPWGLWRCRVAVQGSGGCASCGVWQCLGSVSQRCCSLMARRSTRLCVTRNRSWKNTGHLSTGMGAGRRGHKPTAPHKPGAAALHKPLKSRSCCPSPAPHCTRGDGVHVSCSVPQFPHPALHFPRATQDSDAQAAPEYAEAFA